MREDVEFPTEDGLRLRGWLYRPDEGTGPFPLIVMAHGFSATKEMHLDDFAEVFSQAGFLVLVYDNRNLGASDGEPRGEIDPWQQIRDYRTAITWASAREDVDGARIGVWGSSYSGGHVLVVAAQDHLTVVDLSTRAFSSAHEPKQLLVLPGGHFDAYVGEAFRVSSAAQRDWFVQHLGKASAHA